MMNFTKISIVFVILFAFIFFLFKTLLLRNRILKYLENNYPDIYKDTIASHSIKGVMMGGPEVVRDIFVQERKILSGNIRVDSKVRSLQRKFRTSIFLTLIFAVIWIIYGLIIIRF